MRIEDTDQARLVKGAVEQIISSLSWAGITPDEGVIGFESDKVVERGDVGPYQQSSRIPLYKKVAQQLLDQKKAYKCWCSPERLEEMRVAQRAAKQTPKYDRLCYNLTEEEKETREKEGTPFVIRFFVPEVKTIGWDDKVFGEMKFDGDQTDDFVLLKADGFATYNFANVVDDHEMQISHVIRGQEFLSSTPKHILLYESLGWEVPVMAHVPWILGKNKQKLSKRHGDVSVDEFKEKGIIPEALINYLALLGWNPKEENELFTLTEMIKRFELEDIQKSGAVFDEEKLEWMNGHYIRQMGQDAFLAAVKPYLIEAKLLHETANGEFENSLSREPMSEQQLKNIISLEQERIKLLSQAPEKLRFLFEPVLHYAADILVWKKGTKEDVQRILPQVKQALEQVSEWSQDFIKQTLMSVVETSGKGIGDVFWPVRVALSGQQASPSPEEIAFAIGKKASIQRIEQAIALL